MMKYDQFLADVQTRTLLSQQEAEAVIEATLGALGDELRRAGARQVAARVPERLAEVLDPCPRAAQPDMERFLTRITSRLQERAIAAVEHGRLVCSVLAEHIDDATRAELQRGIPSSLASLFDRVELTESLGAVGARGDSLAAGKPGSSHPLADAHPVQGHRDSIARSRDPHGASKLSGAGADDDATLGSGTTGSERPLSKGR